MKSYSGAKAFSLPCGQCMGCKLDRARDWQTRLAHEASLHESSCFLTLTYSDEFLPRDLSVDVRHVQLFMKRLRKALPVPVRFFCCGEYGEKLQRPHYHMLLFGYDFPDKVPWRKTGSGFVTYRSAQLEKIWTFGNCEIGTVTPQSAGYVARYVTKKVSGDDEFAREHYRRFNPATGEIWQVAKEFIVMSTKPGIGHGWFEQYSCDAFPSDFVIIDGIRRPVPRYYFKKIAEREAMKIKSQRKEKAAQHSDNNTEPRLMTRHESQILKSQRLTREYDDGS